MLLRPLLISDVNLPDLVTYLLNVLLLGSLHAFLSRILFRGKEEKEKKKEGKYIVPS